MLAVVVTIMIVAIILIPTTIVGSATMINVLAFWVWTLFCTCFYHSTSNSQAPTQIPWRPQSHTPKPCLGSPVAPNDKGTLFTTIRF